ncbi:MAG: hypothetical protein KBT03_08070 [Bacteroidales bacterium]|nr:hypothetical protein [Candidatus Scybalousia scybalohippi]
MKATVNVNNVPENHFKYIVATYENGELWYWGSFNSKKQVDEVVREIGGICLVCEVE